MALRGLNAQLLGQLEKASASRVQIYLLQQIIRAVEPNALLSQHSSSLAGMAAELPRFQSALRSYSQVEQPKLSLLDSLCAASEASVTKAMAQHSSFPLLQDLRDLLAAIRTNIISATDVARRRMDAAVFSTQLEALVNNIPDFIRRMFLMAWSSPSADSTNWSLFSHVASEMACLVASTDRDPESLETQLSIAIRDHHLDGQRIVQVLLPTPTRHRILCIVRGAQRLDRLSDLEETARQQPSSATDANTRWGIPEWNTQRFFRKASTETPYCAVALDVFAVDMASAARLGRRQMTEVLDQYIAGGRLRNLSLDSPTLVSSGARVREWEPHPPSVDVAYPLLNTWPPGLREGLRMAHIARVTDSPLTAAALSWVALEASGIEHSECRRLARALSLHALRQQVVESHLSISCRVHSILPWGD
jgi:hypothetical protein